MNVCVSYTWRMALLAVGSIVVLTTTPLAAQQVSADKAPGDLARGEFVWNPEASPAGPVVVVVSLTEQRIYVYRNGILIAYTPVATGKPGHETPTGVFTVLQKDKDHVSSIYHAKMPYTQRLTWGGVSLHAGSIPGYPNSHGCIHLPLEFSRLLFALDAMGTTVVIANEHEGPGEATHPGMVLSPELHEKRKELPSGTYEWEPDRSPEGPVSLLLSAADSKLYVYRKGIEIGVAELHIMDPGRPFQEGVFTVLEGYSDRESPYKSGQKMHRWQWVATTAASPVGAEEEEAALVDRIHIPAVFAARVYGLLAPGTTMLITNRAASPETKTDADFVIMATEQAEESAK